jgi:hypothetical protein
MGWDNIPASKSPPNDNININNIRNIIKTGALGTYLLKYFNTLDY